MPFRERKVWLNTSRANVRGHSGDTCNAFQKIWSHYTAYGTLGVNINIPERNLLSISNQTYGHKEMENFEWGEKFKNFEYGW